MMCTVAESQLMAFSSTAKINEGEPTVVETADKALEVKDCILQIEGVASVIK